jgi:hypothetical protein
MAKKKDVVEGRNRMVAIGEVMHPLGDAPVEKQFFAQLQGAMEAMDEFFNKGKKGAEREVGIIMLVFPYGEKAGRCNYVSNGANRDDVVKLFEEQIKRFKEPRG